MTDANGSILLLIIAQTTAFSIDLGMISHVDSLWWSVKNYSRDIANPELDQLSGRFSPRRGQFGIAACRSIENMELFLSRCADTWNDSRGLIIPIVDDDLVHLLTLFPTRGTAAGEALLQDRYRQIALR